MHKRLRSLYIAYSIYFTYVESALLIWCHPGLVAVPSAVLPTNYMSFSIYLRAKCNSWAILSYPILYPITNCTRTVLQGTFTATSTSFESTSRWNTLWEVKEWWRTEKVIQERRDLWKGVWRTIVCCEFTLKATPKWACIHWTILGDKQCLNPYLNGCHNQLALWRSRLSWCQLLACTGEHRGAQGSHTGEDRAILDPIGLKRGTLGYTGASPLSELTDTSSIM